MAALKVHIQRHVDREQVGVAVADEVVAQRASIGAVLANEDPVDCVQQGCWQRMDGGLSGQVNVGQRQEALRTRDRQRLVSVGGELAHTRRYPVDKPRQHGLKQLQQIVGHHHAAIKDVNVLARPNVATNAVQLRRPAMSLCLCDHLGTLRG